jgi:hypothetical protein
MTDPLDDARRARRVLRGVWAIVEARQRDAVADEVARLGEELGAAIEREDPAAAAAALAKVRAWMATMAGVVTSRMIHAVGPTDD